MMRPGRFNPFAGAVFVLALSVLVSDARPTGAACNIIPGTQRQFRGALGVIDRPFAGPGDVVELRLTAACDAESPGFSPTAEDHVVTVVFTPPNGARNIVLLAADCSGLEAAGRQACGADALTCITASAPRDLEVRELEVGRVLRFRFPDSDALVGNEADDRTLTGPARIAVSRRAQAVAVSCALAAAPCTDQSGLIACVDKLFEIDGTCDPTPSSLFTHFTALPPPNDYQALCVDPVPPCTGMASEVRLTIDDAGNLLLPMDWRGILVGDGVPIARLLRASTSIEGLLGSGEPLRVPSNDFLRSFSPEGGALPPLFDPQTNPDAASEATFFGTADAPATVLRIARVSPTGRSCDGGSLQGQPCDDDGECSGAVCETASPIFDFATRLAGGVGPIIVARLGAGVCQETGVPCADDSSCPESRCVAYRAAAQDPVPLEGLASTQDLLSFVVPEAIEGRDLNGDGDTTDNVVVLADRRTGARQLIGQQSAAGRAVTRVRQPPFSFPAVAVDGGVVAFLESEPLQGGSDTNADGDVFDAILRVFQLEPEGIDDLTPDLFAIDAAPLINDRSVVISGDDVYYRVSEAESAHRTIKAVGAPVTGVQVTTSMALSADGNYVAAAIVGLAPSLPTNGAIFVKDRNTGDIAHTIPVLGATDLSLSGDGRFTAFTSDRADLIDGDANGFPDVFVHDGASDTLMRASIDSNGHEANGISTAGPISADGRFVPFFSFAGNLTPDGASGQSLFVRDLSTAVTERLSIDPDGRYGGHHPSISADGRFATFTGFPLNTGNVYLRDLWNRSTRKLTPAGGRFGAVSADGRFAAFLSGDSTLVAGDTNYLDDFFVYDLVTDRVERVSLGSDGGQRGGQTEDGIFYTGYADAHMERVALSADGRFVVFSSVANGLVPGDTDEELSVLDIFNGQHLYRHDRLTGFTQRIAAKAVSQRAGYVLELSGDGQVAGFLSRADLDPDGTEHGARAYVWSSDVGADDPRGGTNERWDLTRDGDLDDTVLVRWNRDDQQIWPLGPALSVQVAGGAVAFLRPEAAGAFNGTGPDLNGDGDSTDTVAQLSINGQPADNLALAATAIALSYRWLAALAPESAGAGDLNGDGDLDDSIVHVHQVGDRPSTWINVEEGAETVGVAGDAVVFLTPEAARGIDLDGDGDTADHVVQLYLADQAKLVRIGQAAQEFVLGDTLLAFRTPESAQGSDLNDDGDVDDNVMQIYDIPARRLINTRQAAVPCDLEACDPRIPYRVMHDTVKFLTLEAEQGEDLDGDGDRSDLLLQTFNVRMALTQASARGNGAVPRRTTLQGGVAHAGAVTTIGSLRRGICTSDGGACVSTADCATGGICHVPPGLCILDLGTACTIGGAPCSSGFCLSDPKGGGKCVLNTGDCRRDSDCRADALCMAANRGTQRLVDPLAGAEAGAQVFTDAGVCVEDLGQGCGDDTPCPAGQFCGETGRCLKVQGTCRAATDCGAMATCVADLILSTARDSDADEIADPFDNCSLQANVLQEDSDEDGIGDACDRSVSLPATPTPTLSPAASTPTTIPTAPMACTGDCNRDHLVTVDELVRGINVALGNIAASECRAFDVDQSGGVTVDEIVKAVIAALNGC